MPDTDRRGPTAPTASQLQIDERDAERSAKIQRMHTMQLAALDTAVRNLGAQKADEGAEPEVGFEAPGPPFEIVPTDPFALLDFWHSISGANTLHVNGGKVPIVGKNITVAAASVDCPGTDTGALYVYLEVSTSAETAQIVTSAVSSEPVTELGTMRKVLYELHKTNGSIVIDAIRITDPWVLPAYVQ